MNKKCDTILIEMVGNNSKFTKKLLKCYKDGFILLKNIKVIETNKGTLRSALLRRWF